MTETPAVERGSAGWLLVSQTAATSIQNDSGSPIGLDGRSCGRLRVGQTDYGEKAPMVAMRRRDLVTLLGGAIAALPLAARAQQADRVRRIGMLLTAAADDPESLTRVGAFLQALAQLGWTVGRNVRIESRWGAGNAELIRKHAVEFAALAPDVILAHGSSTVGPLLQATRTVPIVFPVALDPVAAGFADSLWRDPAATPLVSWCGKSAQAGSGWNYSKRSRRA